MEFNQSTFNEISTSNLTTTNGPQLMLELEGLEEYVDYSVRVRAYTSVGPGPFSVAVVNRTLEVLSISGTGSHVTRMAVEDLVRACTLSGGAFGTTEVKTVHMKCTGCDLHIHSTHHPPESCSQQLH